MKRAEQTRQTAEANLRIKCTINYLHKEIDKLAKAGWSRLNEDHTRWSDRLDYEQRLTIESILTQEGYVVTMNDKVIVINWN